MEQFENFRKTFSALGDKTRLKLFHLVSKNNEICVTQLAKELHISAACVSQHMKVLGEAELVERVRNGQRVCYKIVTNSPSKKALNDLIFKEN